MGEEHRIRERTPDEHKEQRRALQKKFLRWVFFSFVLSLSPLFIQMESWQSRSPIPLFPCLFKMESFSLFRRLCVSEGLENWSGQGTITIS